MSKVIPIEKGDTVALKEEHHGPYRRAYGDEALKARVVTLVEKISGKGRLHVDGVPGMFWTNQVKRVRRVGFKG